MNARADHLLAEVLELPAEERSAVVAALIDSLEGAADQAVADAWRRELARRRDAIRSGAVKAAPWAEVRARLSAPRAGCHDDLRGNVATVLAIAHQRRAPGYWLTRREPDKRAT